MEINVKAIILWILYQFLGVDAFRIGNRNLEPVMKDMQGNTIHMPNPNPFSHKRSVALNNRLKRFFEFNPVAFSHESKDIPDETIQTVFHFSPFITSIENFKKHPSQHEKQPSNFKYIYKNSEKPKKLRPYVNHFSGVKSFALHLMNRNKENRQDENDYPEKQNIPDQPISDISMRAFLKPNTENVFDGSAVVFLEKMPYNTESNKNVLNTHLNKIIKPESNTNIYSGDYIKTDSNVLDDIRSNSVEAVHSVDHVNKGNVSDLFLSEGDSKQPKHVNDDYYYGSLIGQNNIQDYTDTVMGNGNSKHYMSPKFKIFPKHSVTQHHPVQDLNKVDKFISSKEQDYAQLADLKNDKWSKISQLNGFHLKDFNSIDALSDELGFGDIYDTSSVQNPTSDSYEDNIDLNSSDVEHSKDGFEHSNANDQSESYLSVPLDPQSYDQNIESLYPHTNEISFQRGTDSTMDSHVSTDQHFGDFGNIIEPSANSFDHTVEGFGEFKKEDSKPYFGVDAHLEHGFQSFEQHFGSFNYDTDDCGIIDTKYCVANSDCSCYGLYQCQENKCVSNVYPASDYDSQQSPIGQWYEEPVDFDSWKK